MLLEDIQMEKKDVLLVSYAKQFAQRRQLPLNLPKEKMEAVRPRDMILIC